MQPLPLLRSWRDCLIWAGRRGISVLPAGKEVDIAWHRTVVANSDLWLILEGVVTLIFEDGSEQPLQRGNAVWLRPEVPFALRVSSSVPAHTAYIHFHFTDHARHPMPCEQVALPPLVQKIGSTAFFEATFRHLVGIPEADGLLKRSAEERELLAEQANILLRSLLIEYERAGISPERAMGGPLRHQHVVREVQAWLETHPELTLTASELARRNGFSVAHFSRIFRGVLGKSPTEVIIEARIRQAKRLLLGSPLNITEIARSLGYEEVFYFSKQFKKVTGISPLSFRSQHRD